VEGDADSGVIITLSGDLNGNTTTSSDGSYSFGGLSNGSYTITPIKPVLPLIPQVGV